MDVAKTPIFAILLSLSFCLGGVACSRKQQSKSGAKPSGSPAPEFIPNADDSEQEVANSGFEDNFGDSLSSTSPAPEVIINNDTASQTPVPDPAALPQANLVLASASAQGSKDRLKITWINAQNISKDVKPTYEIVYKQMSSVNGEFLFQPKVVLSFSVTGKTKPCHIVADNVGVTDKVYSTECEP